MLAFHLRREGLVVMLMTSPDEAIDAIAWAAPDVLLVELTGRGFDGTGFLRSLGELPVDLFGVVSRPLDAEGELEALRYGVVDILTKPLDAQALARRLRSRPPRERRGSMSGLPEGQISGDLAVHSAMYILQMCHRHRMNARLHVEIDGDWGVLLVRHGEVIDAEAPSAAGREAAYQAIRADRGAFVLVPLSPDAEELSRDDVVRADLATLVGDALGRREPRSVNAQRLREAETFVLPHVGSPRGPMAHRTGGDETLEYQGRVDDRHKPRPETARVKRPGETDRAKRSEAASEELRRPTLPTPEPAATPAPAPATAPTPAAPNTRPRSPTRPMPVASAPEEPGDSEVRGHGRGGGGLARAGGLRRWCRSGRREESVTLAPPGLGDSARASAMGRDTIDDGFDEPTDQEVRRERRRAASEVVARVSVPSAPATAAAGVPASRSGLRRMTASRMPPKDEPGLDQPTAPPVRRIQVPTDRMKSKATLGRPARLDGLVIAMAIAAFALAVFVVWRVLANGASAPTPVAVSAELPKDPEVRYGAALADLEAGKKAEAMAGLEALAEESSPPEGALALLARLYYGTGRLMEAESVLTRLTATGKGDARTWAWLGLVRAGGLGPEGARGRSSRRARRAPAELEQRLEKLERTP
ncbi:MAG: DUF4388 domain-containing protein [Myxococcota bacterium]